MKIRMAFGLAFILLLSAGLAAGGPDRPPDAPPAIIPQPVSITATSGEFRLSRQTVILTDAATQPVGEYLSAALAPALGFPLKVGRLGRQRDNSIVLGTDASLGRLGAEGYLLSVSPERVLIRALKPAGAFYGCQSLRQLLPPAIYAAAARGGVAWRIPCVRIEDHPRFQWRGAMVDVARHFMPKQFLLKFIDLLAMHKMNVLHLHLTDNQGWRVEIKKYPKLIRVGSIRATERIGQPGEKLAPDAVPYGGYYSQADLREIVAYARRRYVRVMPEIEMPGHCEAAIAAYPELGNTAKQLEVSTHRGISKNIFNVDEKTIHFLQDVLAEVLDIFPGRFIHVGGDEVPKDQWKASPRAQARRKQLGLKSEEELQSYFMRRMDEFLAAHGRRLVGWDEILEGGLAPGAVVMSWRGVEGGIAAARAGHDVVMAPNTYTYFNRRPAHGRGRRFLPLEKVYHYDPVPRELTPAEARHILGTQGQLWTALILYPDQLEYMAFPRLTALAEVAWTPAGRKDYAAFLQRLAVQVERFRVLGVNFSGWENK